MPKSLPPGFIPGELRTLKFVIDELPPEILHVCSAKVRPDMAAALAARFEIEGIELAGDFKARYDDHLAYSHGLGDAFYEAGYSADFTQALFIYQSASQEEAKALLHADPFYKAGVISDPEFFEWEIHPPLFKGHYPPMPEQVIEVEVEVATPEVLIASLGTFHLEKMTGGKKPGEGKRPWHQMLHIINMYGDGGLANQGLVWAAGPTLDFKKVLHILAVPTVEMAQWANQVDAMYRWGVVRDFRYFEWCIHYPVRKACPRHKAKLETMIQGLQQA